jgi:hypothetical protein
MLRWCVLLLRCLRRWESKWRLGLIAAWLPKGLVLAITSAVDKLDQSTWEEVRK